MLFFNVFYCIIYKKVCLIMKNLKFIAIALLTFVSLQATTIYYNGEENDVGEWSIQNGSHESATLTPVYDATLNSNVMHFSDAGIYRLRLPNNQLWDNQTESVLSLDINMETYYTLWVYVNTLQGIRKLFYNPLNVHAGHHNNQHLPFVGADGTGIINSFGRHRTHGDNIHHDRGWINHPEDKNNRNGWVRVTLDLDRDLKDIEPQNRITSVFSLKITGTAGMVDNVSLDNPTRTTKSTLANDWALTTGIVEGELSVVEDNEERGSVIELNGVPNSSSFTTGAKEGANSWNDTQNDIIQWKIKTENWFKIIVHINTSNGLRDMVYFPERRDRRFNSQTGEIGIGIGERRHLGDASPDNNDDGIPDYDIGTGGTWQTFTRNIAMEVSEYEEGNNLLSINGFTVIGTNSALHNSAMIQSNIFIDDIELFPSIVPTTGNPPIEDIADAVTDLHRWNLRETSVSISFNDQSEGEIGFRYINAETGVQMGNNLPARDGTGNSNIGRINGLTAGTTYRVQVETLFDDGRATATSEALSFTTLGNPPIEDIADAVTDLHRWNLRETSVSISFNDQSEGEIGFRYINAETGVQMGNNLPARDGTGNSNIGRINGLTAGTTYRVQVETLFDDGRATATSEALSFTTLGEAQEEGEIAPANDLHRWRLRATSVRISFADQSEGESGFRFINEATGEQLRADLPATAGTGTASIGRINGLTSNTTYHVQIQTLLPNGVIGATSEAIEFTTLAE